jgi:hypothetical protein
MRQADPRSIVEAYLDALVAHDYDRARTYLADEGFRYESPISNFSSADDFIQHMSVTGAITQRIARRKVFTDGADVCHLLLYTFQLSEKETARAAQWAHVTEGRIQSIEFLFDASRYHRLFHAPPDTRAD